tara:strand:+ start:348 stop:554 length:207 start_codon:yes stop_codon:yes gene_type:complete
MLFIGKKVLSSAKRNLFKDQAAWSGNDIKIKYRKEGKVSESKGKDNFLKIIADESKNYLEVQSEQDKT